MYNPPPSLERPFHYRYFLRFYGINRFHVTSLSPCWRTITKDSSLASIVSSSNMAAMSLSFDSLGIYCKPSIFPLCSQHHRKDLSTQGTCQRAVCHVTCTVGCYGMDTVTGRRVNGDRTSGTTLVIFVLISPPPHSLQKKSSIDAFFSLHT